MVQACGNITEIALYYVDKIFWIKVLEEKSKTLGQKHKYDFAKYFR